MCAFAFAYARAAVRVSRCKVTTTISPVLQPLHGTIFCTVYTTYYYEGIHFDNDTQAHAFVDYSTTIHKNCAL